MKISVFIATSLDGFIAREDGGLDWLPGSSGEPEDAVADDHGYGPFFESVDVMIMGRNTFEMVLGFGGEWPYAEKPIVVLSSTLQPNETWASTVEAMAQEPAAVVETLSSRGFKHAYLDGGKTIQRFLNAGLVDELIITRIPVIIGQGIPLFGPTLKDIPLELLSATPFDNGMVQLHYKISHA